MPPVLPLSLEDRRPGRIRPELGPLTSALNRLGDPQHVSPSVLIVGTNGKGSTAAMLEAVLKAHGIRTGLTTSPHLVAVEERIRIDGSPIDAAELDRHLLRLTAFPDLTFFETLTAAAFLAFAEARVEVAILEAGMGGSWDATRVASSAIAGITNVGTDHPAWLGETSEERARDKGEPLKAARWAVWGPDLDPELIGALGAPAVIAAGSLVGVEAYADDTVEITWDQHEVVVPMPLEGAHQIGNLHLALALARCAESAGLAPSLEPEALVRGLRAVDWPGRLSRCRIGGREIMIDGAHNLEGARALAVHLRGREERHHLLFSCLDDKPVEDMARVLAPVVDSVAVIELDDDRAMPLERLAAAFGNAHPGEDLITALEALPDPVVAAGSLRLVGRLIGLAEEGGGP